MRLTMRDNDQHLRNHPQIAYYKPFVARCGFSMSLRQICRSEATQVQPDLQRSDDYAPDSA